MPFIGAVLSHWHGGGFNFPAPKVLKNIAWALPFGIVNIIISYPDPVLCIFGTFLCVSLCLLKAVGHGGYIDLGTWEADRKDESTEFLIKWLKVKIPEYWYDVLGLSVVGFLAVSGAILYAWVNPWFFTIVAVGGLLKPIGYMLGWKFCSSHATVVGEYIAGFLAYLGLAVVLCLI